jgi:hypothetical protein
MIYVDRDSEDENGAPIRPNSAWFNHAAKATETAIQEQGEHEVDEDLYKHTEVRKALERLFHDKCAYCEWKPTGGSDWDVEHFRPKGHVAEREDHPGYYWLAYTWSNLYPSCAHCNQNRKDKPRWADPVELPAAGKLDQFPLGDESTRVMSPDGIDALLAEDKLLIDPCNDQPEKYIGFDPIGQVFSLNANPYGEATIQVFNLRRRRLRALRHERVTLTVTILKLVRKYEEESKKAVANDFRSLIDQLADGSWEFAAVTRYIVRDPEAFNVT